MNRELCSIIFFLPHFKNLKSSVNSLKKTSIKKQCLPIVSNTYHDTYGLNFVMSFHYFILNRWCENFKANPWQNKWIQMLSNKERSFVIQLKFKEGFCLFNLPVSANLYNIVFPQKCEKTCKIWISGDSLDMSIDHIMA